jgi:acetyl-CoA carboxylase carboxyltransferase component
MDGLFRHYTAEHQLIEEEEEEVYTYQSSNKEMYYASENIYIDVIIGQNSDFAVLLTQMNLV